MGCDSYELSAGEDDDDSSWEECGNESSSVTNWYDLDGRLSRWQDKDLDFFTHLIDPSNENEPFFDRKDKKQWGSRHVEVEGYTGNEGCNRTTTYQK